MSIMNQGWILVMLYMFRANDEINDNQIAYMQCLRQAYAMTEKRQIEVHATDHKDFQEGKIAIILLCWSDDMEQGCVDDIC